ncbi:hypothetical protein ACYOEI_24665, partial [Singulisphaera rosea]
PRTSLAEVAGAMLAQPWVHSRSIDSDQRVSEFWYSPSRDISATRGPGSIEFDDFRVEVYHSYNPEEGVVYRGPIVWRSQANRFDSMAESLKVLLRGENPPDKPLANLRFLGPGRGAMKVLDQRVEKVVEPAHTWLDYHLTVKYPDMDQPLGMLFRVDAATKLPQLSRIEQRRDGKSSSLETRYDYPETGPVDLYALGVPKTAKLVDRVPAGDLDRVWKTLQAGRERMDNYRTVFVQHIEGLDYQWWRDTPIVFYRKGNKFRADYVSGSIGDESKLQKPADGEDLRKWWFERTKSYRFYTQYVLRDSILYSSNTKMVKDADGSPHQEIESVQETRFSFAPGETFPSEYVMRPEFTCRPPLGLGHQHLEPRLDLHPAEGPPGCFLLSIGHTSKENRVNDKGIGIPDGYRYWLDPQRDDIIVRWEMAMRDDNGKETIISNHTIEETARSPQGVWYATKVRLKRASRDKDGKSFDQVYHMYVDFDVKLDDSFFEPPTPGRIE